jgi:succinate dehydrogenase / fumarate reductase flavoprotein subunit
MYERITGEDPYKVPMRIYPAVHYTMGGLWVDYNLMSTIPGLFVLGEANFSDHGANRLGASALMQGLADGYFVIPYTIGELPRRDEARGHDRPPRVQGRRARGQRAHEALLGIKGKRTVDSFHRELGKIMWDKCGMARTRPGLSEALARSPSCARSSGRTSTCRRHGRGLNQSLEKAGRVADFLEFAELMCRDALEREESCGGHFREEYQTTETARPSATTRTSPRRGLGVQGRGGHARAPQGAARPSRTSPRTQLRSYK